MSRLEVDVKSIQKIIRDRALKAQKILSNVEAQAEQLVQDVRQTLSSSPFLKNFKKTSLYQTAFNAALNTKDELEKRASETKLRVLDLLNVPTKKDLEKLNKKVETLTKKIKAESQKVRRTANTNVE